MSTLREQALTEVTGALASDISYWRRKVVSDDVHVGTVWLAAPIAGQLADAASTLIVIQRMRGRAAEGNPIMAPLVHGGVLGQAAFLAGKLGVGAGLAYGAARIARAGHPTAAKAFSVAASALGFAAATHNVSLLPILGRLGPS